MNSWSKRRKKIYAAIVIVFLIGVVGVPAFLKLYNPPTCFDGRQNGREQGIDCGGSCIKLCPSAFLAPQVAWTRYEEIAPGVYNMAAYIVNPNTDGAASGVPYRMVIYDKDGVPIVEKKGTVTIPAHRNTLAFQTAININKSIPASRIFEFTGTPDWTKASDPLAFLTYDSGQYTEDASGSAFTVALKNSSANPIYNVSVYVVLKDKDQNVIGFSKTFVEEVPARGQAVAPFTWPTNRRGKVISQEVLPVAE